MSKQLKTVKHWVNFLSVCTSNIVFLYYTKAQCREFRIYM